MNKIAEFIKMERKAANLTQEQFAELSGIGLHALRDLEQGKDNITLRKINQALAMFGMEAVPGKKWDDWYLSFSIEKFVEMWYNYKKCLGENNGQNNTYSNSNWFGDFRFHN